MVNGFEQQTQPLNAYESDTLLPVIARGLSGKVGKRNAITNRRICEAMTSAGYNINDARLRKIINHVRTHGIVPNLIATSAGYYVATSRRELEDYIASLRAREQAIREVRIAMEGQLSCSTI